MWGFTVGYNWGKMCVFVKSLRKSRFDKYNVIPILIENNWPFYSSDNIVFPINNTFLNSCIIKMKNFGKYKWMIYRQSILSCWLQVYSYRYSHIMCLDVRDVVFQGNPFEWNFEDGMYIVDEVKSDNFFIKHNIYNLNWIKVHHNYTNIINNKILNAGTLYGSMNYFLIFIIQLCQFVKENKRVTTDQDCLNYAYYTSYFKNIKFLMNKNQRGVVLSLDLEYKHFRDILTLNVKNSTIYNEDGTIPVIVHQYDRCKNFSNMYRMKYS